MQLFSGTSTEDGTVYCPRINLSEASELPSQVADSAAWPARSRKQQLEGLFFSPRAICTSPDDFSEMLLATSRKQATPNGSREASPRREAAYLLPAIPSKPGHLAVANLHLNLPEFVSPSSRLGDVSHSKDTSSRRIKPLDLSRVQWPDGPAKSGRENAADSRLQAPQNCLPLTPSNTPIQDLSIASQVTAMNRCGTQQSTAQLSGTSIAAARPDPQPAQHAQQAGLEYAAVGCFKLPKDSAVSGPQQASRLGARSKSWQLYGTAGTARGSSSPNSNSVAAKSWQQTVAGATAHEQWVMQRHLTHGRMSEAGSEERWGELQVRLPKQASSSAEQLVQQLPEELNEAAHVCHVIQDGEGDNQLSVLMGGKPTGRNQTLLLASWLRDQISACSAGSRTSHDIQSMLRLIEQTSAAVSGQTHAPPNSQGLLSQHSNAAADAASRYGSLSQPGGAAKIASASASMGTNMIPQEQARAKTTVSSQALGQGRGQFLDPAALSLRRPQPGSLSARQVVPKQAALGHEPKLAHAAGLRATPSSPNPPKPTSAFPADSPHRLGLPASQSQASVPSWQELLPEESGSLGLPFWADEIVRDHIDKARMVLGLLGTAFGVLVHQVAMHCFERGALMAGLWNMYTALMDAEVQSLEDHVQNKSAVLLVQELMTGGVPGGSVTSKQLQRMVTALDLASDKGSTVEAELLQAKSKALLYETISRELEEEALQRELEAERLMRALQAASAAKERKQGQEVTAKEQQISELQAELLEQSSLIADLASKLETVTRDVTGLGRFMTEQLVPATPKVEHTTQGGSRRACVGSDALSTADELVEGVAGDLQQVIMKMKQATHVQCTSSSKFGTNKAAVLHTLVQQESIKKLEEAPRAMQNDQDVNVDRPLIANVTERRTADQGPQNVTMTIKIEEPVYLTIDAGRADEYEYEIADLRAELTNLQRQLVDSRKQLADTGGTLKSAQERLAQVHGALSIERQKTRELSREIKAVSEAGLLQTAASCAAELTAGAAAAGEAAADDAAADEAADQSVPTLSGAARGTKDGAASSIADSVAGSNADQREPIQKTASELHQAVRRGSLSRLASMGRPAPNTLAPTRSISSSQFQEMRSSSPLPMGKVNQLQEAMTVYPDVKPRSVEWCLKLIDALFKSKRIKDAECDRANVPRALFMDHVFAHLLMTYGAKNMVTEFAACLMVTARRHKTLDLRIEVFEKFAAGEWDLRILSGFLAADQLLGEPTRVPCCDYPPTHAPVRYASPWVCLHKCIFVADMVLGKRSAATTHGFAARLVAMAEPAEEQEVQKYYVDPQNTAEREAESASLAKSLMKSGMMKMSAIHFKQALCMELLRCESILKDTLPSIIKEFDLEDSGSISQVELSDVLAMFEGPDKDPVMLKKECEKVWKEALQLSMAESSQASVSGERAQSDASSSSAEVDIMAAAKACRNSELPRRFVRLYYTAPLPTDESAQQEADMAKMMFLIVKRHWRQHEETFTDFFAVCGHKENYLKDQAARFMEEGNHQRKVQLFFTITLTLLDHQLFNLRQKCSPAALAADPRSDVEGMFSQIANAIKVLYGRKCLLQDDFTDSQLRAASPSGVIIGKARKLKQDQMSVYSAVQAKVEHYAAQLIGQKYLKGIQRWRKQAEMTLSRRIKGL